MIAYLVRNAHAISVDGASAQCQHKVQHANISSTCHAMTILKCKQHPDHAAHALLQLCLSSAWLAIWASLQDNRHQMRWHKTVDASMMLMHGSNSRMRKHRNSRLLACRYAQHLENLAGRWADFGHLHLLQLRCQTNNPPERFFHSLKNSFIGGC